MAIGRMHKLSKYGVYVINILRYLKNIEAHNNLLRSNNI